MKQNFIMKKALTTAFSLLLGFSSFSQEKTEDKGKFTFSGYLDSYYMANFNSPIDRSNLGASGTARAFDIKSGQFSLGLVQAKMTYSTSKLDIVSDLTFGPNSDLGNYGNVIGRIAGSTGTALAIKQAYVTWKATDKFSLTMGQFGTHIGYEVIDAPINYHYSLSNLFNNGPFYHVGLKAQYNFSDKVYLMGGIVNNVDNLDDNNRSKGIIGQLFVSPVSGWNVYLNAIASNEANPDAKGVTPDASYSLFDLTTTYQITPKFMVGVNAASGSQKGDYQTLTSNPKFAKNSGTWGGVAFYTNYSVSDVFSIGARYESFNNQDAVRGLRIDENTGVTVNSLTITTTFTVADGHLLIKPEFRSDAFDKNFFVDGDGKAQKSQSTLGLAVIAKF
jgi:Putative beta-barrel porin-2, OmpL-like. bbp2